MKKIFYIIGVSGAMLFAATTYAQDAKQANPTNGEQPASLADIKFDKTVHDFGTIPQGGNGECEFTFTNTGKEPLVITNCMGSCGCTVPQCPKEPVLPGKKGTIKVKYDTNRVGPFVKSVTVNSNAKSGVVTLQIKGTVEAKPVEEAFPQNKNEGAPKAN
ncbi:MAG: hypothetical protein KatS3mg027_1724 [Bacteroidia bacterium]|nr:MAG: hypothetical protein KatS3mg027_1724 [Bacteroidia bacterium]